MWFYYFLLKENRHDVTPTHPGGHAHPRARAALERQTENALFVTAIKSQHAQVLRVLGRFNGDDWVKSEETRRHFTPKCPNTGE